MKSSQLAIILLIACASSALALRCNRCVPLSSRGSCIRTVETCWGNDNVCASVIYSFHTLFSYFKRCMRRSDAFILQASPYFRVYTCETDLCN